MRNPASHARSVCICGLLALLACILSIGCRKTKNPASPGQDGEKVFRRLTVLQADSLIQANLGNANFIIVDVRTPSEYGSGHLENALSVNYNASDFEERLNQFDKTATCLVYCRSGSRSAAAVAKMQELGFLIVYEMLGGISAWIDAGYPVVH